MHRILRALSLAAVAALTVSGFLVAGPPAASASSVDKVVAVYRFYNVKNGTHFYTASTQERDGVIARWPSTYSYEGVSYYVDPQEDAHPLHRFYNRVNGSHFYTASSDERDGVLARWPHIYTYEGVGYNVSINNSVNGTPAYRFYNKRNGSHFYTTSEQERAGVIAKWPTIYTYEGTAFYASATSATRAAIADRYGTFEPVTFSGTGNRVLNLPSPLTSMLVEASHSGRSNFIVTALDSANEWTGAAVNEIGKYSGVTAINLDARRGSTAKLQVRADGNWTVTIAPVAQATVVQRPFGDTGPGVFLLNEGPSTWNLSHRGSRNFIVEKYFEGQYGLEWGLVANEIGDFSGQAAVSGSGPAVVEVQADGKWTIR